MMYISQKFIEKQAKLNEFAEPISQAAIWAGFLFIAKLIISLLLSENMIRTKKLDNKFTEIIRRITGDNRIEVYSIENKNPNAFVVLGGGRGLYYTKGLLKMFSDKEMTAILLHEYGHYKNKDVMGYLLLMGSLGVAIDFIVVFISMFGGGAITVLAMIIGWLGYDKLAKEILTKPTEIKADSYAVEMGYGRHLASGLKKIEKWMKKKICKNLTKKQCSTLVSNMQTSAGYKDFKERAKDAMRNMDPKSILKGKI